MIEKRNDLHLRRWFVSDVLGFSMTTFCETELQAWLLFLGFRGIINGPVFFELVRQAKQTGFYCDNIDLSMAYDASVEAARHVH